MRVADTCQDKATRSKEPDRDQPVRLVQEVMIAAPRTLSAEASVGDVRAAFADDHVHMVLLTRGRTLVGTLVRTDLPQIATATMSARQWSALLGRTVAPEMRVDLVQDLLVERGTRRLAVIEAGGTLLGLLCLKRSRDGFCSDADVAARARDRSRPAS